MLNRDDLRGFDDTDNNNKCNQKYNFKFSQKNVFSLKNNPMCGVTVPQWFSIISNNYKNIEYQYYPRMIFITILSIINSSLGLIETILYESKIKNIELADDPIFIIGHPRTGTTLLHNTLSLDNKNFYYCTTFCAGFPSSFLWFEKYGKILFANIIEKTRPMDNMPLHFDLPQEDECATNLLSYGKSYYMVNIIIFILSYLYTTSTYYIKILNLHPTPSIYYIYILHRPMVRSLTGK